MGRTVEPGSGRPPDMALVTRATLVPRGSDGPRLLAVAIAVGAACIAGAAAGRAVGPIAQETPVIWPPAGIAAALLIVMGARLWPAVAVGAVAGLLLVESPGIAIATALGSTVQAVLAGLLTERARMRPQLDRLVDVGSLAIAGCLAPSIAGAAVGIAALVAIGAVPVASILVAFVAWSLGSGVATFVAGDVVGTWATRPAIAVPRSRLPEAALALVSVAVVAVVLFFDLLDLRTAGQSVAFPIIPVVLWVAFRAGPRGNALATLVYAAIAVTATSLGLGPFVGSTAAGSFFYIAIFTGLVSVTGAAVAAVVAELEAGRLALYEAGRQASEALDQLAAVERIGRTLAAAGPTPEALAAVVDALADVFGYSHPSIYTGDEQLVHLGAQRGYATPILAFEASSPGIIGTVMRTRETVHLPDVAAVPGFIRADPGVRSEICVPLVSHGSLLGILNVESTGDLDARDLTSIAVVADRVSVSLRLATERANLAEQAVRDSLTGLHNRRYFDDAMVQLAAQRDREGPDRRAPMAAIMFDLDHFGAVNKDHGVQVGDDVLRTFGRILRERFRASDVVARYGGEEFVAILLDAQGADAVRLADWVRRELASVRHTLPDGASLVVTVSAGVAASAHGERTPDELVHAADAALRQAKRAGRDQVLTA